VSDGYDLALTEILENNIAHYFYVKIGSEHGQLIANLLPLSKAEATHIDAAEGVITNTTNQISRHLDTECLKDLLNNSYEHSHWESVAERCLGCANCTMVCPTCFCSRIEDVTDLTGEKTQRLREWDSCFTNDFSYIHGGSIRSSIKSQYRQWLTHKLSTWFAQFGTSGCIGCGRCITWCPVGIDLIEEVKHLRTKSVD
jgi:formate hydrogenlyase subunit 6/NADH:ubiquinone oxidoreductase subunit I